MRRSTSTVRRACAVGTTVALIGLTTGLGVMTATAATAAESNPAVSAPATAAADGTTPGDTATDGTGTPATGSEADGSTPPAGDTTGDDAPAGDDTGVTGPDTEPTDAGTPGAADGAGRHPRRPGRDHAGEARGDRAVRARRRRPVGDHLR